MQFLVKNDRIVAEHDPEAGPPGEQYSVVEINQALGDLEVSFATGMPGEGGWSAFRWAYQDGVVDRLAAVYLEWESQFSKCLSGLIYDAGVLAGYEEHAVKTNYCIYLTDRDDPALLKYKERFDAFIAIRDAVKAQHSAKLTEIRNLANPPA